MSKDPVIEWTEYTDDGDELPHELPARYEVCPRCRGTGSHVNPSIDGHGITEEERERDWSDEDWERYLTGFYDVTCYDCKGLRVVKVVDRDACDSELLARYEADLSENEAYERMCEAERRYGC
jgi:hypothetical protein